MLIGTNDFYHFTTLTVTLIVAKGLKVSRKQAVFGLFSHKAVT